MKSPFRFLMIAGLAVSAVDRVAAQDEPLVNLQPLTAIRAAKLGAGLRLKTEWYELGQGGIAATPCTGTALVYDAAELDAVTGNQVGGTCVTGGSATTRFTLSVGGVIVSQCYRIIEDMTVRSGYEGTQASLISLPIVWNPPAPEPLYVIVNTYDTFNSTCSAGVEPASNLLEGVVFQVSASLAAGTYLVSVDLCSTPDLWLKLPNDGQGAFEIIIAKAYNGAANPPTYTAPTAATFARWGTEPSRPGSTGARIFVDYSPADGTLVVASECVTLTPLPATAAGCGITNVGVAASMWAHPCSSVLLGDANCDGQITNFDIDFFVNALLNNQAAYTSAGGSLGCWNKRSCWGDINHSNAIDNFDIDPFVACIVAPPPIGSPCP